MLIAFSCLSYAVSRERTINAEKGYCVLNSTVHCHIRHIGRLSLRVLPRRCIRGKIYTIPSAKIHELGSMVHKIGSFPLESNPLGNHFLYFLGYRRMARCPIRHLQPCRDVDPGHFAQSHNRPTSAIACAGACHWVAIRLFLPICVCLNLWLDLRISGNSGRPEKVRPVVGNLAVSMLWFPHNRWACPHSFGSSLAERYRRIISYCLAVGIFPFTHGLKVIRSTSF